MRSRFCATARIICVFPYKTRGPHDQHSRFQRELRTKFALESHTVFGSKFDRKSCENCVERGSRTRLTEKTLPKAVLGSFWSPRRAVGASRATFSTPRGGLGRPPGAPGGPPGAPGGSPGAPGGFLGPSWGALWRSWGAPGAPEASRGAPGVDLWSILDDFRTDFGWIPDRFSARLWRRSGYRWATRLTEWFVRGGDDDVTTVTWRDNLHQL